MIGVDRRLSEVVLAWTSNALIHSRTVTNVTKMKEDEFFNSFWVSELEAFLYIFSVNRLYHHLTKPNQISLYLCLILGVFDWLNPLSINWTLFLSLLVWFNQIQSHTICLINRPSVNWSSSIPLYLILSYLILAFHIGSVD